MEQSWHEDKWWLDRKYHEPPFSDIPLEQIEGALALVIEVFNSRWVADNQPHPARFYLSARGTIPFRFLFELGEDLLVTSKYLRFPSIVHDLRVGSNFSSARLELSVAAAIVRFGINIEFRPPLPDSRESDLSAEEDERKVFIEVKQLSLSDARSSAEQLGMRLISSFSELQRATPWSRHADAKYEIVLYSQVLGLLGAGAEADEASIRAIVNVVTSEVEKCWTTEEPPFEFDVDSYARVRISKEAKCAITGPPFAPELELKRILQKYMKDPAGQLPAGHPGLLVIQSGSVLDAPITKNSLEQLLVMKGAAAAHISAVIFLSSYPSRFDTWSLFQAFAVFNPVAQVHARNLRSFVALAKTCNIME